jgi:hypothetical protein
MWTAEPTALPVGVQEPAPESPITPGRVVDTWWVRPLSPSPRARRLGAAPARPRRPVRCAAAGCRSRRPPRRPASPSVSRPVGAEERHARVDVGHVRGGQLDEREVVGRADRRVGLAAGLHGHPRAVDQRATRPGAVGGPDGDRDPERRPPRCSRRLGGRPGGAAVRGLAEEGPLAAVNTKLAVHSPPPAVSVSTPGRIAASVAGARTATAGAAAEGGAAAGAGLARGPARRTWPAPRPPPSPRGHDPPPERHTSPSPCADQPARPAPPPRRPTR